MNIEDLHVAPTATIKEVLTVINEAPRKGAQAGIALVVDDGKQLLGIATDGDIRKGVIGGAKLSSPVKDIMNSEPIVMSDSLSYPELVKGIEEELRSRGKEPKSGFNIRQVLLYHDHPKQVTDILNFYDIWRASEAKTRHVCIVGMGYVGLTLAVTMADVGLKVTGTDISPDVVSELGKAKPPFHETGLQKVLERTLNKTLTVQSTIPEEADVYIICVGTPVQPDNTPNLEHIKEASRSVGKVLKRGDVVIVRSTVPVGTCRSVVLPELERASGMKAGTFFFASMPERTLEGKALQELRELPQIVGGYNKQSTDIAINIFRELTPFIVSMDSLEEAEMAKLLNNVYRDSTFGIVNEFALACNSLGLSANKIIARANEGYPRGNMPQPSPGVGGYCLRKDPYLFMHSAKKAGFTPQIIPVARKTNESMPYYVSERVLAFCQENGIPKEQMKVFLLGFAFKGRPETSDTRFSTTLDILSHLKAAGITNVHGYDAVVKETELNEFGVKPTTPEEGFDGAHAVLFLNNHTSHSDLDLFRLAQKTEKPLLLFDGWGVSSEDIEKLPHVRFVPL
ncbi:hypothetical protein CMO91_02020 [Candidatus Woesearchaeota archaeon]|nr:hypothetical protein [Candidatus Woesearchaeota archaeon]